MALKALPDFTLFELSGMLHRGEISSRMLTTAVLNRLSETDDKVGAYAYLCPGALDDADRADARRKSERNISSLLGIPVAVKDVFHTADAPTAAGSRVLRSFRPARDATVVAKLRAAGAVLVGKTVTHEFAYGMNTPRTRNPWNLACYPGGSSAGSAVSVAVGSAVVSVGTDTAGSVRTPASVNGIVGLKPTYGRISRAGVIPASPSLDHVGVMGRSVRDCAMLLEALAGHDPLDRSSLRAAPPPWATQLRSDVAGLRLGVDRSYFMDWSGVADGVRARVDEALELLKMLGVHIVDVSFPLLDRASAVGSTLMSVDYSVWHRNYLRTRPHDYEPGTRRMLLLGHLTPATAYVQAQRVRLTLVASLRQTYEEHSLDAVVGPTIPLTAPTLAEMGATDSELDLSGLVHHSFPANLAGLPCISVPCGFAEGMPVGMQIMGRPLDETTVMSLAAAYETAGPPRRPVPLLGRSDG